MASSVSSSTPVPPAAGQTARAEDKFTVFIDRRLRLTGNHVKLVDLFGGLMMLCGFVLASLLLLCVSMPGYFELNACAADHRAVGHPAGIGRLFPDQVAAAFDPSDQSGVRRQDDRRRPPGVEKQSAQSRFLPTRSPRCQTGRGRSCTSQGGRRYLPDHHRDRRGSRLLDSRRVFLCRRAGLVWAL